MTLFQEEAKALVRDLWHVYFKCRSDKKLFNRFLGNITTDFVLIGMGADEVKIGLPDALSSMQNEMEDTSHLSFKISDEWYETQEIGAGSCSVLGGFALREESCEKRSLFADIDCRFTAICVKINNEIHIKHIHLSVPNLFQTSGEFFPSFINDKANEILQEEITKKTDELEKLNEEFIEQEELYRVAISASDDIILVIDVVNHKTDFDKEKIQSIYDIPTLNIEKDGFFNVVYSRIHPDDKARFSHIFQVNELNIDQMSWFDSLKEPINIEYRIKHNKYGFMWIRNTVIPIRNNKEQLVKIVSHLKNINEHKRREQELHGIAIRDGLTNLYNKVYTEQSIGEVLKSPDSCGALFMIDIDNFKSVNDTVGHLFADDVLKMFANILSSVFRSDDIVGRFGGDEFIAFMKYKGSTDLIKKRADEIIQRFDSYLESLGGVPFKTSCSIGVAVYPQDGRNFSELYKNADCAMYASKSGGKHRFSFFREESAYISGGGTVNSPY